LSGVEKEPWKNYTKFLGGNLGFEHLHPSTHTIFSGKNSQLTRKVTCVTKDFAAVKKAWQFSALVTRPRSSC